MFRKKLQECWFTIARGICRIFCRLFLRMDVEGKENVPAKGPCLLVSNHQSFLDPLFCGIPLRRHLHFLARDSLFKNRFFGWLIGSVNSIPVKRGEGDLKAMKKVIKRLKESNIVCIFPEGTRSLDGRIADFKPGFGLLSRRGWASVVPVVIEGAHECWPKGQKCFNAGSKITVRYGQCIPAEQVHEMDEKELARQLTHTVRCMQKDIRTKLGKEPYSY